MLELLLQRRSVKAAELTAPGPDAGQLQSILTAAARVPDHKKLVPWRFILFQEEARAAFGKVLAEACAAEAVIRSEEQPSPIRLETEQQRFMRAPLVVALISRILDKPGVPEIEQILSCGAAGQNLCLAANALGFGTNWLTEWYAYSPMVATALGLAANERVAGFIYVGTAKARQPDRDRPPLDRVVSHWRSSSHDGRSTS